MSKGSWTATAASTALVAADEYRDQLFIQKTNNTTVALGIGEAAVAGEGIQLTNVNDVAVLRGAAAREAIYMIGNNGAGTYQTGNVEYVPGPTP